MGAVDEFFLNASVSSSTRPKLTLKWGGKCAAVPDVVFVDAAPPPVATERAPHVIEVSPWTEPDALDLCLDCWKRWMSRDDADLSAQSQKTLRGDGDGYGNADTSAARRDNEIAEATEAMIGSLRISQRWAIHQKCGVSTTWRFPNLDFVTEAHEACIALEKKLRNNIATRLLFS